MSSYTLRGLVELLRKEAWAYYEKQEGHPNIFPYHVKMRAALLIEKAAGNCLDRELSAIDLSDIRKVALEIGFAQHVPEPSEADINVIRRFLEE